MKCARFSLALYSIVAPAGDPSGCGGLGSFCGVGSMSRRAGQASPCDSSHCSFSLFFHATILQAHSARIWYAVYRKIPSLKAESLANI